MSLGLRTVKIASSAFIAIIVAGWLGLDYAIAAGIIAILSVLDTKKTSLLTAGQRLVSTILALSIAAVLFSMLLGELFYIHFLVHCLGIAYILELKIYLNVQA